MSAGRLRPRDEENRILFDGSVDREWVRRPRDIDGEISETKTASESRLPPRRSSLGVGPRRVVADEVFFTHQCVGCGVERRRGGADLLSVALDDVIVRRRLYPQRDFGELVALSSVRGAVTP